jgi:hypothetical protein
MNNGGGNSLREFHLKDRREHDDNPLCCRNTGFKTPILNKIIVTAQAVDTCKKPTSGISSNIASTELA